MSRKGLVTKRSSRPTTPITSYSKKKALTKEDYKELIAMHSKKLTESDSAPTLTFVDLTEEDVPSFKKAMTVSLSIFETSLFSWIETLI